MGILNFFTRKNNSKNTINNMKANASQQAYWQVKKEFGRAPQSKTANILRTPGTFQRTNAAAIRQQELANKFTSDMGKELQQFGTKDKVKNALQDVINQLDRGLTATSGGANSANTNGVTITIPKAVAKLLKGILKIILFSITILFTIALALAGANGNLGGTEAVGMFATADAISFGNNNNDRSKARVEEWNGSGHYNKTRRNRRN
jgi:hypothetical protein